jgi:hypothetical protein
MTALKVEDYVSLLQVASLSSSLVECFFLIEMVKSVVWLVYTTFQLTESARRP